MTSARSGDETGDRVLLRLAQDQAELALVRGELPVGAAVIYDGKVVAARGDEVLGRNDPTGHAVMIALRDAAAALSSWRLVDCVVAVTLEPCVMCTGALLLARVPRLIVGTRDAVAGACGSRFDLSAHPRLNHVINVTFLGEARRDR